MKYHDKFSACLLATLALIAAPAQAADPIYGVPLPNPAIPDYVFPAPETALLTAVNNADTAAIYRHGWGLWASLTAPTAQTAYGIANAPVYLTWLTKQDLVNMSTAPATPTDATARTTASGQGRGLGLKPITQLRKFGIDSSAQKSKATARAATAVTPDTQIFETVAYDPTSAKFINDNKLFVLSTIQAMYTAGQAEIPTFPVTAVSIKPVYKIASQSKLIGGKYYAMPAWPGTPVVTADIVASGYPETAWPGCVYVDVTNPGASTSTGIDGTCGGQTAAATYGLGDFIAYAVTSSNVAAFNAEGYKVAAGDYLLLMAMHVTSREISEWTWQTYFWTPAPMNPPSPSSDAIASAQPAALSMPAAHYAMSIGYQMISPNQPVNGGNNDGKPVIAYNPYLESGFNAEVFSVSRQVTDPNTGVAWTGQVGVETNCMTCHALAAVNFGTGSGTGYATTFYIGRNDPIFAGTVQTDFLWSIADVVSSQQQSSAVKK
ncbi:hypothetical protein [Skermanella pratensis]|uniref:hypothetical protein n=1 Tax=Skermanella pratensis TaxID=2233999 RepID=UPI0013019041|nr:hypothetical protein [Skermanella pratensis]